MYFLGIDVGSSSVKVSVLNGVTGKSIASTHYPKVELDIASPQASWAEQHPDTWWDCVTHACRELFSRDNVDAKAITAVGITYQMHGLVAVDADYKPLRPAIIWCDSRAVSIGETALKQLGAEYCFDHLLNSPGNFTASKLRWVQENEPDIYARIHKIMLPGDYIALKLSGDISTTATGLSEGILWDFKQQAPAERLLEHWHISPSLLPKRVAAIGPQATVNQQAAETLGLTVGIPICYRCGDQPNNAFSLNVLEPGEVAANAGTSGVIYGVTDKPLADRLSRINTFQHVTHTDQKPRNGMLVCVNGTGRAYSWLRQILSVGQAPIDYVKLNELAVSTPIGSDGLNVIPFGNGAERIFNNRNLGAHIRNIELNRHSVGHIIRATQEGIVFALNSGFDVLKNLGGRCEVVKAGRGNMFLSDLFAEAFANTTGTTIQYYDTDGAEGAARGAAIGCGYYTSHKEAFAGLSCVGEIKPTPRLMDQYQAAYQDWCKELLQVNELPQD